MFAEDALDGFHLDLINSLLKLDLELRSFEMDLAVIALEFLQRSVGSIPVKHVCDVVVAAVVCNGLQGVEEGICLVQWIVSAAVEQQKLYESCVTFANGEMYRRRVVVLRIS